MKLLSMFILLAIPFASFGQSNQKVFQEISDIFNLKPGQSLTVQNDTCSVYFRGTVGDRTFVIEDNTTGDQDGLKEGWLNKSARSLIKDYQITSSKEDNKLVISTFTTYERNNLSFSYNGTYEIESLDENKYVLKVSYVHNDAALVGLDPADFTEENRKKIQSKLAKLKLDLLLQYKHGRLSKLDLSKQTKELNSEIEKYNKTEFTQVTNHCVISR